MTLQDSTLEKIAKISALATASEISLHSIEQDAPQLWIDIELKHSLAALSRYQNTLKTLTRKFIDTYAKPTQAPSQPPLQAAPQRH